MGHFIDTRQTDAQHPKGYVWPIDVVMTFTNNGRSFVASGVDEVGPFEFKNGRMEGTVVHVSNKLLEFKRFPLLTIYLKQQSDFISNPTLLSGEKCSFLKVYPTHSVTYEGLITGHQVMGQWWITDYPDIRGEFSMWPDPVA